MLIAQSVRQTRSYVVLAHLHWLSYAVLVAFMVASYVTVFLHGPGMGVDFACFRAAAVIFVHGGNPYDFAQLWRVENALYNAPLHLRPGAPEYYGFDRYYNPPLFAAALIPLIHMPLTQGYAVYACIVAGLAVAGTWLTLLAAGWTRRRLPVVVMTLASPLVFLAVWNGQQSTLLFCALGAALYATRRGYPCLAGAFLALGWVKPHLLVPIALAAPLLLAPRMARRWYAGFGTATVCGVVLTILTTGTGSIDAWLRTLFGYTGYVDAIQNYLPSLSGMALVLLAHPWNRLIASIMLVLGVVVMILAVIWARRSHCPPWIGVATLMAIWLVFTPFAHTNDDVLLLPAIVAVWGRNGTHEGRIFPYLVLWAISTLSLSFFLPGPLRMMGALPPVLVLIAVGRVWTVRQQVL